MRFDGVQLAAPNGRATALRDFYVDGLGIDAVLSGALELCLMIGETRLCLRGGGGEPFTTSPFSSRATGSSRPSALPRPGLGSSRIQSPVRAPSTSTSGMPVRAISSTLPTGRPAEPHPVTIELAGAEAGRVALENGRYDLTAHD